MNKQSTSAERTGNTAYRDPTGFIVGGSIGACAFALVLYFPIFMLFETYVQQLISTPYTSPFGIFNGWQILSSLFSQPDAFFTMLFTNKINIIADIIVRLTAPVFISFTLTYFILRNDIKPRKTELLERGKAIESNEKAFKKYAQEKLKNADGIKIHADVRIPLSRETEHILIAGATGAGKSQALTHIISSVRERKDSAIIFDIKGDYTAQMVSADETERKAAQTYLVAPWDSRSITWNIAADITDEIAAQSFAEAFIVKTGQESNPYFVDAARDVFTGCLEFLMHEKQQSWSWADLTNLTSNVEKIRAALLSINHSAFNHISQEGIQTQGAMGSLRAPTKSLETIAKYWNKSGGTAIVNGFMNDNAKGTLILAARPDMQSIATPLIAGLLALLMQKGLSLPDSKSRRIWFIIDELGALPKISKLVDFITLARSKGMCLVAGIQDLGRLHSKYGKDETATIASQFGTLLIGYLGDPDTAKWAVDLFGQQRIERLQVSESQQNAVAGLSYQPSVSTTWQQTDKAALIDSDFLHLNKATKGGFFMWCKLTSAEGAALLGKLHYKINPVPSPFPACIAKPLAEPVSLTPAEKSEAKVAIAKAKNKANDKTTAPESSLKKANKMNEKVAEQRKKINKNKTEEKLEAIIDNAEQIEPEKEQEKEPVAEDDLTAQIGGQALDLIVPGIDTVIEIADAFSGEVTNKGAGQTQQTSKRKRKFRLRNKNEQSGGME